MWNTLERWFGKAKGATKRPWHRAFGKSRLGIWLRRVDPQSPEAQRTVVVIAAVVLVLLVAFAALRELSDGKEEGRIEFWSLLLRAYNRVDGVMLLLFFFASAVHVFLIAPGVEAAHLRRRQKERIHILRRFEPDAAWLTG